MLQEKQYSLTFSIKVSKLFFVISDLKTNNVQEKIGLNDPFYPHCLHNCGCTQKKHKHTTLPPSQGG